MEYLWFTLQFIEIDVVSFGSAGNRLRFHQRIDYPILFLVKPALFNIKNRNFI